MHQTFQPVLSTQNIALGTHRAAVSSALTAYAISCGVWPQVGAKLVPVQLQPPNWDIPRQQLEAAFSDRTKFILVNTPHNPTGKVGRVMCTCVMIHTCICCRCFARPRTTQLGNMQCKQQCMVAHLRTHPLLLTPFI
jgi:hypothetical protein